MNRAFFAAVMLLGSLPASASNGLVETIARVKPGVVGIASHNPLNRPQTDLLGTGFVVADGRHVLTAIHVIDSRSIGRNDQLSALVGEGESAEIRKMTVVARDTAHDIALLRLEGSVLTPLVLGHEALLPDGTDIAFTGFPIGAVYGLYPATHRGMIAASTPIARPQVSPGALTADMIRALDRKLVAYQLDATSFPGNSGGPVYVPVSGVVIGMVNSTFVQERKENTLERPSGVTFAMPIAPALKLLKDNGLSR